MENKMKTCLACNSTKLEPAILGSATLWLEKQSAWSRAMAGAEVKALACMDCGFVTLRTHPDDLKKLAGN